MIRASGRELCDLLRRKPGVEVPDVGRADQGIRGGASEVREILRHGQGLAVPDLQVAPEEPQLLGLGEI